MSRFPSSSSSTFLVPPFLLDHHIDIDKRMSGKGFIEPHRNNLPRRKRKVVTSTIALEIDKTISQILPPTSEAGPRSSIEESNLYDGTSPTSTDHATFGFTATSMCPPAIQTQIHASSSVDTNITEPPSSLRASPTPSSPLHNSPVPSNSSMLFLSHPTFQTPKRSLFHGYHLDDALPRSPPPITPSKGHLQPTSATLPRRHRLSVAREEQRRRSLAEQQRQSICAQELSKGITLGFLADGDGHDENIVRIKVYDDSTTPFASPPPPSPASTSSSTLSSGPHLQLTLPTDSSSYTDGTTCLTDCQIQQACTFIDEHISIPLADTSSINSTLRPGHVSVLILTPCIRPEEAMSIGISYLAGIVDMGKDVQEMKGDKAKYGQCAYSHIAIFLND